PPHLSSSPSAAVPFFFFLFVRSSSSFLLRLQFVSGGVLQFFVLVRLRWGSSVRIRWSSSSVLRQGSSVEGASGKTTALKKILQLNLDKAAHQKVEEVTTFISGLDDVNAENSNQSIVFTHLILTLGIKNILVVINEIDAYAKPWAQNRFNKLQKCLHNIVIAHDGSTTHQRISGGDEVASFVQQWVAVDLLLDTEPTNVDHWNVRVEIFFKAAESKLIQYADWFEAATKANKFGSLAKSRKEKEAFTLVNEGHKERAEKNIPNAKKCYDEALKIFRKNRMLAASSYLNVISIELEKELKKIREESKEEIHMVEPEKTEEKEKTGSKKKKRNKKKGAASDQPQVVEQEKCEEEKDAVSAKEDEKKAVTSLHIASSATYEITVMSHYYCQGMKILNNGISLPQSFVACTDIQLEKLVEVVSMGFSNSNILTVSDIVQIPIDGETKSFFAAEPVEPLDMYFQLKYEKWCSTDGAEGRVTDLSKWWFFIEDKFHSIYRDVMNTVFYLYSKGSTCGDLFAVQDTIYITTDEHPRILPSMNAEATSAKDVKDLSRNMKGIINLPYAGKKLLLDDLPDDLSHLFTWFKTVSTMQEVPLWFLLDHYIFWTPQERVDFIMRLKKYVNVDFLNCLDTVLAEEPYFWTQLPEEGIFNAILMKGDPNRLKLPQDDKMKKAVYTHYNDMEYASLRTQIDYIGFDNQEEV
ncbi:hypothetical protein V2J09_008243, partial [Rumex salicifolius]